MRRRTLGVTAGLAIAGLALARPAAADVTIRAKTTTLTLAQTLAAETVTYVKGQFMRVDTTMNGREQITIFDVDTRKYTILNPQTHEAIVTDAASFDRNAPAAGGPTIEMTPTGETKEVAGLTCEGYTLKVAMPMTVGEETATLTMNGPVWASKSAPGAREYAAFLRKAVTAGLILGDPRAARVQPDQARGTSALLERIGQAGVPCESDFQMSVEGQGPMAGAMGRMGGSEMKVETLLVTTDPIDPDLFAIPKGYTIKNP